VWSLGERLFPDEVKVRLQMFDSLVLPIILYASEVTGYTVCHEYERCLRRYVKWTLGLPRSTPNSILSLETGIASVRQRRIERAAKYSNRC
jgi:hypothetical protein